MITESDTLTPMNSGFDRGRTTGYMDAMDAVAILRRIEMEKIMRRIGCLLFGHEMVSFPLYKWVDGHPEKQHGHDLHLCLRCGKGHR